MKKGPKLCGFELLKCMVRCVCKQFVKEFFIHTGKPKKLCGSFYCGICFIAVVGMKATISLRYACNDFSVIL